MKTIKFGLTPDPSLLESELFSLELSAEPELPADVTKNIGPISKIEDTKYVMNSNGYYSYEIHCYVIEKWIRENSEDFVLIDCRKTEFKYDYDKKINSVNDGSIIFSFRKKVYNCKFDSRTYSHIFTSSSSVLDLLGIIKNEIKEKNPLRRKHMQLVSSPSGFTGIFKPTPSISFDNLILNELTKEDVYDNTIFQLKNLKENNGIILHGPPGTGKSLCCQAIVHEALNEGFSTCFLTTAVNYTQLSEFIEEFLSPCIIIFEDMDSFGRSRDDYDNTGLSDFLQFLSGLSENKSSIIFIGTTNYLNKLDDAISNRPVRFNRKFEFKLPSHGEIDQLIELYFKDSKFSDEQKSLCYDKKFTGSHIKEVHRTAKILSIKSGKPIVEVFCDAVKLIQDNFPL